MYLEDGGLAAAGGERVGLAVSGELEGNNGKGS